MVAAAEWESVSASGKGPRNVARRPLCDTTHGESDDVKRVGKLVRKLLLSRYLINQFSNTVIILP